MAVLMPEGAGVLPPIDAEDKPRIRVRLHFGGTFAQDGPRQWRYVGGEVYNESFPLDSKYAEVMKRLNDKFGDTVSFKYLCPGDDIDPDNLVQVQGDDDLQEMCDEYHNALQKSSTPVKTVRIKVFVFRAVIFEREVQELDEELGEDDELMDLPDDGLVGALSSCDQVECGPNWSDWGEPDEHDITQTLPAEFSSDKEHLSTADAVAAAAATAALHNISMSVHSVICGRPHIIVSPAPLTSAGAIGGTGGKAPVYGVFQPQQLKPPQRVLGHQAPYPKPALAYGPPGKGNGTVSGGFGIDDSGRDCIDVLRSHFGGVATAPLPAAVAGAIVFGLGEAHFGAFALREMDASPGSSYPEESRGAGCGYMDAEHLEHDGEQLYANVWKVGVASAAVAEETEGESEVQGDHEQTRTHEPLVDGVQLLRQMNQRFPHEDLMTEGSKWMGTMQGERGDLVQVDWRHGRERGLQLGGLEQQQTQQAQERQQQEQQRIIVQQQQTQQAQERQNLNQIHRDVLQPSCLGFFCDDELEDPYGEPYDNVTDPDAATTAAGLICPQQMTNSSIAASGEVGAGNRSSAPSDGAGRSGPRLADMAVRGEQVGGLIGGGGGQLARMPAVADMLPRHISAFGESSRDDNNGAVAAASGPLLPSRITVFGDGESLHENLCCTGSVTRTGGDGQLGGAAGGLHRLALHGVGGGAAASSPWANLHAASRDAAVGKHVSVALLGLGDELVGGDSRLCITQEFGTKMCSSLMDPGDEVSGLEDATGNVSVGGDVLRLDPRTFLEPLSRTGLGRLGGDGLETLGTDASHNHPLRGVVKKRKSEVSIMAKIGEGAFGEVSQAQVFPYGIVAIKWLKRERFAKYSESFQREAETLAKLNHPNIIRMYGLVMDSPDTHTFASDKSVSGGGAGAAHGPGLGGGGPGGSGGSCGNNNGGPGGSGCGTPTGLIGGIITEFVRNGSLGQYLRSLSGRRLSLRQRAMIALQASLGMAYLHEHSPAVVHFDLKPDNLLVDGEGESMVIKVADFGLSKHKLSNYVSCRDLRGTLPYMASELVTGNGNISEKVDVYSMGVVMWEMYTGDVPFSHLTAHDLLHGLMHGSLHLNLPPECEPEWRSLVETCMDQNPANRPSFPELAMQLQEILRLERQSSNASSASAAAAAAAAAVLNSDPVVAPAPGPEAPPPIAPAPIGGDGGLVQLPLPGIKVPGGAIAQAQPQVRSPGAGPPMAPPPPLQAPQALLARQQQHLQAAAAAVAAKQQQQAHTLSPQQQQPLPLLAQLQQQHVPQQPFPLQQQFRAVPYVLPQQVMHQPTPVPQPQQAVQPLPAAALAQPPIPHHLHFLQQFSPALLMQNQNHQQQLQVVQPPQPLPPAPRPTAHLYGHLPLVPLGLYQQPQQPGQLINGLYGLAGGMGAGGGGLPPLVSWADGGV